MVLFLLVLLGINFLRIHSLEQCLEKKMADSEVPKLKEQIKSLVERFDKLEKDLEKEKRARLLLEEMLKIKHAPLVKRIDSSSSFLRDKITEAYGESFSPDVGMVLGSGLGVMIKEITPPEGAKKLVKIRFEDIPNFAKTTFSSKSDIEKMVVVIGMLSGRRVITTGYRLHYYEGMFFGYTLLNESGHTMDDITFPARVMIKLGIRNLLITNACGSTSKRLGPGDMMLIEGHINMCGVNPLRGKNYLELGKRFPDCTDLYDSAINKQVQELAKTNKIELHKGVYMMFSGPTYENPPETEMARKLGGGVVGMSTVPEAVIAAHAQIKVTAISLVTNYAAGVSDEKLDHEKDVLPTVKKSMPRFVKLVKAVLPILKNTEETYHETYLKKKMSGK